MERPPVADADEVVVGAEAVAVAGAELRRERTVPRVEESRLAPDRFDDGGVHPVCDLVGGDDRDRVEARLA